MKYESGIQSSNRSGTKRRQPLQSRTPDFLRIFFAKAFFGLLIAFVIVLVSVSAIIMLGLGHVFSKNIVIISNVIDGNKAQIYLATLSTEEAALTVSQIEDTIELPYAEEELSTDLVALLRDDDRLPSYLSLVTSTAVDQVLVLPLEDSSQNKVTYQQFLAAWRHSTLELQKHNKTSLKQAYLDILSTYLHLRGSDFLLHENVALNELSRYGHIQQLDDDHRKCSLAVVNTTQTPGLAAAYTDYFEQYGVVVVRVTDSDVLRKESFVIFDGVSACDDVLTLVGTSLSTEIAPVIDSDISTQYRASAVLLLGNEAAEMYELSQQRHQDEEQDIGTDIEANDDADEVDESESGVEDNDDNAELQNPAVTATDSAQFSE